LSKLGYLVIYYMAAENEKYTAYYRFHAWKRSVWQYPDQERTNVNVRNLLAIY